MNNQEMVTSITLEELLAVPLAELERITGWNFKLVWFNHMPGYRRENIRITSPKGRVINIKVKSWKLGPGVFKDEFKVCGVANGLDGRYILHLVEEVE